MFCGKCGAQVPEGNAFCGKCGAQVMPPEKEVPQEQKIEPTALPQSAPVPPVYPPTPAYAQPQVPAYPYKRKESGVPILLFFVALFGFIIFRSRNPFNIAIVVLSMILFIVFIAMKTRRGFSIFSLLLFGLILLPYSIGINNGPSINTSIKNTSIKTPPRYTSVAATSTPNPNYKLVQLTDIVIEDDILGLNQGNFRIKNDSKYTVDAVTIIVKCTDNYGEKQNWSLTTQPLLYLLSDGSISYIIQGNIKPSKTSKVKAVSLAGYPRGMKFQFAVKKWHAKDGKTVEIPESEWHWYEVQKD